MTNPSRSRIYRFGEFCLRVDQGSLWDAQGEQIHLRPKSFQLLVYLLENPDRLLSRDELIDAVWPDVAVTDDSLTQCLGDIRRALKDKAGKMLRTLPRRGYLFAAEVIDDADKPSAAPPQGHTPFPLIVLEPLTAADGDRRSSEVSIALTTELVRHFAAMEDVRLLVGGARGLSREYRLQGSTRLVGSTARATLSLQAGTAGATIWADKLDKDTTSPAEPNDHAPLQLAMDVVASVRRDMLTAARRADATTLDGYQLSLIGADLLSRGTRAATDEALAALRRAAQLEPHYALPRALIVHALFRRLISGWYEPDDQTDQDMALETARQGLQLEPDSPCCLAALALALVLHRQWEEAKAVARVALKSAHPADALSRTACAAALLSSGEFAEALTAISSAIDASRTVPMTARTVFGAALLLNGETARSYKELRACSAQLSQYVPLYTSLFVAAVETGHFAAAHDVLEQLRRLTDHDMASGDMPGSDFYDEAVNMRFRRAIQSVGTARS